MNEIEKQAREALTNGVSASAKDKASIRAALDRLAELEAEKAEQCKWEACGKCAGCLKEALEIANAEIENLKLAIEAHKPPPGSIVMPLESWEEQQNYAINLRHELDMALEENDNWLEMSERASKAAEKQSGESMPEAVERLRKERDEAQLNLAQRRILRKQRIK